MEPLARQLVPQGLRTEASEVPEHRCWGGAGEPGAGAGAGKGGFYSREHHSLGVWVPSSQGLRRSQAGQCWEGPWGPRPRAQLSPSPSEPNTAGARACAHLEGAPAALQRACAQPGLRWGPQIHSYPLEVKD